MVRESFQAAEDAQAKVEDRLYEPHEASRIAEGNRHR
jgi:hypothetical protein